MDGYEHVAAAHEALCDSRLSPRPRLARAAEEFWKALPYFESWPHPLRQKALAISTALFDRGSLPTTLAAMTDPQTAQTLRDLEDFTSKFLDPGGQEP